METDYLFIKRKIIQTALVIILVALSLLIWATALSEGYCGDNMTWTLSDTGVITLSGTGSPFDYKSHEVPWYEQRNNIYSIVVEDGINSLGSYFFEDCENLTSITFGKDVENLGVHCIDNCPGLTELTLPDRVTMLSLPSISRCPNLTVYCKKSAYYAFAALRLGNVSFIVTDADSDFIIKDNRLVGYAGDAKKLIIPSGVTGIGYMACSYLQNTEEIILPNSVTAVSDMAFQYCTKLTKIEIPESLIYFGPLAFGGCTSLEMITIPNSMSNISSSVFNGCTGLKTVYIPASVTTIQWSAFGECTSLETVCYYGTEAYRNSRLFIEDRNEPLMDANWIYEFDLSNVINLPSDVTVIDQEAFYGNNVNVVRINSTCTAIGNKAFGNCYSLVEIHIPLKVVDIADNFLEGSPNAVIYCQEGSKAAEWADTHSWRKILE